eukprot:6190585-Pleurochrysis_carterae.AAC.4
MSRKSDAEPHILLNRRNCNSSACLIRSAFFAAPRTTPLLSAAFQKFLLACMHDPVLVRTPTAARGMAPAPLMRALLSLCFLPSLAHAIIDWIGPGGGRFEGGCRTGPPGSGGTGTFEELWAVSEADCRNRCGSQSHCLAYEWVSLPQGYSRCELHRVEVTHALPVTGSVCFVKRMRTASSIHAVTTSNPANPTYQQTMAQPTPTIQPPWQQPQQPIQRNRVVQQAPPPPPPHPCGSMLLPNTIVQSTPECMDLINADLRYMDLSGATFEIIDMTGADLRYANLAGATFSLAPLAKANFSHANLNKATIAGPTDLAGADFTFADLRGATISGQHIQHGGSLGNGGRHLYVCRHGRCDVDRALTPVESMAFFCPQSSCSQVSRLVRHQAHHYIISIDECRTLHLSHALSYLNVQLGDSIGPILDHAILTGTCIGLLQVQTIRVVSRSEQNVRFQGLLASLLELC